MLDNKLILENVTGGSTTSQVGPPNNPIKNCNCRVEADCPLTGNCLTESLIYKASVNHESYIGLTGGSFKQRYNGHKTSFRLWNKENDTKLSKYIWELKDKGQDPEVKWECVVTAPTYFPVIGRCILCLREKERILYYKEEATLNSRNEVASNCRHRRKFYLL